MIVRSDRSKSLPLNVVGSSIFGRYPKISIEKTLNMFISDGWMVPYAGYQIVEQLLNQLGVEGRALHTSTKLNRMIGVVDNNVWLIDVFFDQDLRMAFDASAVKIGTIATSTGVVYVAENNKPQVVLSDGVNIYYYDPTLTPSFQIAYKDTKTPPTPITFTPGYIDYHDTYILAAASNDTAVSPTASNTWQLGIIDSGGMTPTGKLIFPASPATVGQLQTKPDNTQAVVRFPSRGNLILVMGSTVTEPWYDLGYQQFPYVRSDSFTIDYGCLNPATIATMDDLVVWLAINEKSGPVIMFTTGGMPEKITTDGIDYLFSQLTNPADSQGFIYRQDGHIFYHINFYTDNLSLFYDFNTKKFFHASDQNLNYFIANEVAFFNNQYYFLTNKDGNLYAFDTIFTTYQHVEIPPDTTTPIIITDEIPRFRSCMSIRDPSQQYFIANDLGFTIETGETPYQQQDLGEIFWITQDGKFVITQGNSIFLVTQDGNFLVTQDDNYIVSQQTDSTDFDFLIFNQRANTGTSNLSLPRVDLSISIDGGQSFGSDFPYYLNPPGVRRSRLMWWQAGIANDFTPLFKFWGMGRFVVWDGIINVRQ